MMSLMELMTWMISLSLMMLSFNHLFSYFAHSLYVYKSFFHVASFVYLLGVFLFHHV